MINTNALIAFNSNQVENFLDNFRSHVTGQDAGGEDIYERIRTDFAPFVDSAGNELDPYNRRDLIVLQTNQGGWKPNNELAPVFTIIVTMYIRDVLNDDGKLSMIEYLRTFFDGRYQVLGCWQRNGIIHGQTLIPATYDKNGDEVTPEEIIGNRTYPLHPQYLKWMPDDLGGIPATTFKQVNKLQGHPDRRI